MRHTLLAFAALPSYIFAQSYQKDWRTVSDCITWTSIDNATEETCEDTLRFWHLEPVRFHNWNPSVGLDCKPWPDHATYCVLTNTTVWDSINTSTLTTTLYDATYELPLPSMTTDQDGWTIPATRTDAPARTTSTRAPIPSPATWKDMGCFVDTWNDDYDLPPSEWKWILDFRFVPKAEDETLDKCKQKCWEIAYPIAGVKGGNECFCGDRNNGTLAQDQGECNIPCVGDSNVLCGGTNRTSIWEAEGYVQRTAAASAETASRTNSNLVNATPTATASSGARRNMGLFWRM